MLCSCCDLVPCIFLSMAVGMLFLRDVFLLVLASLLFRALGFLVPLLRPMVSALVMLRINTRVVFRAICLKRVGTHLEKRCLGVFSTRSLLLLAFSRRDWPSLAPWPNFRCGICLASLRLPIRIFSTRLWQKSFRVLIMPTVCLHVGARTLTLMIPWSYRGKNL